MPPAFMRPAVATSGVGAPSSLAGDLCAGRQFRNDRQPTLRFFIANGQVVDTLKQPIKEHPSRFAEEAPTVGQLVLQEVPLSHQLVRSRLAAHVERSGVEELFATIARVVVLGVDDGAYKRLLVFYILSENLLADVAQRVPLLLPPFLIVIAELLDLRAELKVLAEQRLQFRADLLVGEGVVRLLAADLAHQRLAVTLHRFAKVMVLDALIADGAL
jgi:hypothetical protein